MTKILITGGTGFIGVNLVRYLLKHGLNGFQVEMLLLVRDKSKVPPDFNTDKIKLLVGTLADLPELRSSLTGIEYVFHLAAEADFYNKTKVQVSNVDGTRSLLTALSGNKLTRFIYAGTIGAVDRVPEDPCSTSLTEDSPPNPLTDYGRSKLAAEKLIAESGFNYSVIRITWAYGPGMRQKSHLRHLIQSVSEQKLFTKFNFPGRVSVIHVSDLVRAFALVAEKKEANNQIYFASDGLPVSLGTILRTMGEMTGRISARINIPGSITAIMRKVRKHLPMQAQNLHSDVLCADNARLVSLGFQPQVTLREGLFSLALSLDLYPYCKTTSQGKRISLITGAAGGIGKALAELMAVSGHRLLLIDKDNDGLSKLSVLPNASLRQADLAEPQSLEELSKYLSEQGLQLDWVVNNAGIGARGTVADLSGEQTLRMIALNCTALTVISSLAATDFQRSGRGVLINIASSAAFQPLPGMAVYAATKSFVISFTRSLRGELAHLAGVKVLAASPSGTKTGFQASAGVKNDAKEKLLSADFVAAKIVDAAYTKQEVIIGMTGRVMEVMGRVLPVSFQINLWRRLMQARR